MTERSSGSAALLQIEDYHFTYPSYPGLKSRELFSGLNFRLDRGEFCIVLGTPESGKTTLSRCLAALYPGLTGAVSEGRILLDGEAVTSRSACDWIEKVGIVFQDPEEQVVTTRCDDEAAFIPESLGLPPAEISRRMERAFKEFGVSWPLERNPLSLSGGEKKRLLLSCLRIQDPVLWILDEPLDELDRGGQTFLLETLSSLAEKENRGILLFASKYHSSFESIDARIAVLQDGQIIPRENRADFQKTLIRQGLVPAARSVKTVENTGPEDFADRSPAAGVAENGSVGGGEASNTASPLIEIRDLKFHYPDNPDFSLEIESFSLQAGETVVLAGHNGCGKSTLARLLCGLLTPDAGSLLLQGRSGEKSLLNKSCGYLFQNPDYQLFLPTVADELELGLKRSGLSRKERKSRVDEAVTLFDMPGRDAPPSLMSFGARKRLQGGIYSLLEKRLYILDEADSGLNYREYETIVAQLKKKNCALIVISHNSEIPLIEGDRLYEMCEGRISATRDLTKGAGHD